MTDYADAGDIVEAADNAFALVDTVAEPWLYRLASQAVLDTDDTSEQFVQNRPRADKPELMLHDRTEPTAWLRSDDFVAVRR